MGSGFFCCGEAGNGREALVLLACAQPDICIVDIKMPDMDGLQFFTRACVANNRLQFIFLSGYAEFDYARAMMRHGCTHYLLKPMNHKEMADALNAAGEKISAHTSARLDREGHLQLTRYLNQAKREDFARQLLAGRNPQDKNISEQSWLMEPCLVGLIAADHPSGRALSRPMREAAEGICAALLKENFWLVLEETDDTICFLLPGQTKITDMHTFLLRCKQELTNVVGGTLSGGYNIRPAVAHKALAGAKNGLAQRFYGGPCYLGKEVGEESGAAQGSLLSEQTLVQMLRLGERESILDAARQLLSEIKAQSLTQSVCIATLCYCYLSVCRISEYIVDLPTHHEFQKQLEQFIFFDEVEDCFLRILERLYPYTAENDEPRRAVGRAILYIDKHYNQDIGLREVAGYVNLNTSYFSALFKRETGVNFMDYLTGVRIEKAKSFLLLTSLKVYEIAAQVGYPDSKYFNRAFRKAVGLTPGGFRERPGSAKGAKGADPTVHKNCPSQ